MVTDSYRDGGFKHSGRRRPVAACGGSTDPMFVFHLNPPGVSHRIPFFYKCPSEKSHRNFLSTSNA
jgi:hypothetical protein